MSKATRVRVKVEVNNEEVAISNLPIRFYDNNCHVSSIEETQHQDVYLRKGDKIYISNQMRPFVLTSIKGKRANFTKFNDKGNVIDSFFVINNKIYLFAITSGSARRGVVHIYYPPKDQLEELFEKMNWSKKSIETVDTIDCDMYNGGNLCKTSPSWFNCQYRCDGNWKNVGDGDFINFGHYYDTMVSPSVYHIDGGSYAIEVTKKLYGQSSCKVYKTKDADLDTIVSEIESMLKSLDIK